MQSYNPHISALLKALAMQSATALDFEGGRPIAAPSYPLDRGNRSGVRAAKRAAVKRKNRLRAKRAGCRT